MPSEEPRARVLLIDEERRGLRLAQAFLMRDYVVSACESAAEGLKRLEHDPYHVLVVAHHLRSMDVFDVCRRGRDLQSHLMCLIISTELRSNDPDVKDQGFYCLNSPYHPATLLDVVERLVTFSEEALAALQPNEDNSQATA